MEETTQAVAGRIAAALERESYTLTREMLDRGEVTVARRRRRMNRATVVIADMDALTAETAKTFYDSALALEMRDDGYVVTTLAVTVAAVYSVAPEAVEWVRSRRLDAGFFPVIADVERRQITYPGLTVLGAGDWLVKRRLVRRCVAPALTAPQPNTYS